MSNNWLICKGYKDKTSCYICNMKICDKHVIEIGDRREFADDTDVNIYVNVLSCIICPQCALNHINKAVQDKNEALKNKLTVKDPFGISNNDDVFSAIARWSQWKKCR